MSLQDQGIDTVEGSRGSNPFPKKRKPSKSGANFPRMIGIEHKVIRGDNLTPILPQGMMAEGGMVDESVNGQTMGIKFD